MSARLTSHNKSDLVVGGFVPLTTADLPGKLSAVIFCQGCPWQCAYCHNPHLISSNKEGTHSWEQILSFLNKRKGLLDAVVFSGGEPTLQPSLLYAIKEVRDLGFEIGLHTAGQFPSRLKELLPLLSWIGMDIKAPFGRSEEVTGRPSRNSDALIVESARMIIESGIDYEFRTTVHSALLHEKDLLEIGTSLATMGAKRYILQNFRPVGCSDHDLCSSVQYSELPQIVTKALNALFPDFELRGYVSVEANETSRFVETPVN